MRIAVFGAAGRTGRNVVRIARARGHDVTAFVREGSPLEGVDLVEGDARDAAAVDRAVGGADAVISVLSLARAEDEPGYSDATRTIVDAAGRAGVGRVIVTANNDVLTDREVTGEFAAHAREHRRNRRALEGSSLDWTILAAAWVTDDEPLVSYDAVIDDKGPGRRIGAADFGLSAVDALDRREWVRHVVGVSAA